VTTVLNQPALSGMAAARAAVRAAAEVALWSLTDTQVAAEVGQALALRAQADAVLLARLGRPTPAAWPGRGVRRRWSGGCVVRTAWAVVRPAAW